MRITRIVALAIIAGSIGVHGGFQGLEAQTLRAAGPPSEFPPASYKGNQYVDSRGCIYIRAGVDGNVTWIPRVTRSRKQLCGYKPTTVAGTSARKPLTGPAPEMITLPQGQGPTTAAARATPPAATAATPPAAPQATAPAVVTSAKPRRTAQSTSANPARVTPAKPRRVVKPAPVAPAPQPAPSQTETPPAAGGCPGASAFSQQFINKGANVRCGPQSEPPVTYGRDRRHDQNSSLDLAPGTRILPAHVYQQRRLSTGLEAPEGYRSVWDDDRLNPRRAERTAKPAVLSPRSTVPSGYVRVVRDDDRMNAMRGARTAEGDAQMAQVWNDGLPRTLVRRPIDRATVTLAGREARSAAEMREPLMLRLSTRSAPSADAAATAPATQAPRRYVRAATFADPEVAKSAAQALARATGLPVRMGTLTRADGLYKVVLAGPFTEAGSAQTALQKIRRAGYPAAGLSK